MDININLEVGRNIKRLREEKKLTLDGAARVPLCVMEAMRRLGKGFSVCRVSG